MIYRKLTFDEYQKKDGLNFSKLKNISISPMHFKHLETRSKTEDHLSIGHAVHSMVLEGDNSRFVAFDGIRRGKKWDEFREQHYGVEILPSSKYEIACRISDAVLCDEIAGDMIRDCQRELSIFQNNGLYKRKCRIDAVNMDKRYIVDLKTSNDVSNFAFSGAMARYFYHAQMAYYEQIFVSEIGENRPFDLYIIAVENKAPFDVVTYKISDRAIDLGNDLINEWMSKYLTCSETDQWDGIGRGEVNEIDVPAYCYAGDDSVELIVDGSDVVL